MKLSIIIPIYNSSSSLKRCLDSVIGQTYKNLEIILINDGSTDNSLEICNQYKKKDKRIKIINQKNSGSSMARKAGIEKSTGDLIGFVDSDDIVEKNMFEVLVSSLEKNKSDIAVCGYYFDYVKNKEKSIGPECKKFIKDLLYEYLKNDYIECMLWNKIFKKELFSNVEHYNFKKGEDLLLCIQLINNAKVMNYVNMPLYNYYINPNSIMRSKFNKKSLEELKIYDLQYKYFKQNVKNFDECLDYLYYKKFNCTIRIIRNMCDDISFIKNTDILNQLYIDLKELFNNINNKKIILPLLQNYYNKIIKYKYFYFVYLYCCNTLRKLKRYLRRK